MNLEKGKLHYDEDGKIICHICGRSFHSLDMHINMSHDITVSDYKKEFGLNNSTGLRSEHVKNKLRQAVKENYEKVVTNNLIERGKENRFKVGGKGRTREQLRLQELNRIKSVGGKNDK